MDYSRKKYWNVRFFPVSGERKSPDDFIRNINRKDERVAIYRHLREIEEIKIAREWPGAKPFKHDGIKFRQVTVGDYRLYIYLDTDQDGRNAVVCHACLKKKQAAHKIDKQRAAINIKKYLS